MVYVPILVWIKIGNGTLCNSLTASNCFDRNDNISPIQFKKNDDKGHIRNIHIKYTIIIIVKYTIAENELFVVQSQENYNKININHTPSIFLLYNTH